MDNSIFLSICIPTYNRAEMLKSNLLELLKYSGNDIEIIISDNCSEDNTEQVVKGLKDDRIKYFKNNTNLGYSKNAIKVIKRANGEFVTIVSDEDFIFNDSLEILREIIKNNPNCSSILGGVLDTDYAPYIYREDKTFLKGKEAMEAIAFTNFYITGVIYNRTMINLKEATLQFEKPNNGFIHAYPHKYLLAKACLDGDVISLNKFIFKKGKNGKHYIEKFNESIFFDPMSRVEQFRLDMELSNYLNDDYDIKINMALKLFRMYSNIIVSLCVNKKKDDLIEYFGCDFNGFNYKLALEKIGEISVNHIKQFDIEVERSKRIINRIKEQLEEYIKKV